MADPQKANELPECPTEGGATAEEQDMSLRPETSPTSSPTCEEPVSGRSPARAPPPGLLSMPCLLKELRRDSSPEQPLEAAPASTAAQLRPQEDSDSSLCLRSPSSSGHLGDSDTLSSAEEATEPAPAAAAAGRKSSRRSRSESDASGATMAAKKNRCQERQVNGRGRGRGPRSQRQKERMRLLRQKREAAARRKPDLLQDSSTSDSDITAHSSSSSSSSASSDNEGGTVNSHAPAGRRGNEASRATAQGLLDGGVASGSLGGVLEEALTRFATMQRQTEERFRVWMERLTRLHSDDDNDQSSSENPERRSNVSSFLPSSESQETLAAYQLARLNANPLPHTQANTLNEGPAVIGHYDVSDTHSEQEQQHPRVLSGPVEAEPPQANPASSDSEVEIVGVQENARFPRGGVIQSLSSWKQRAPPPWTAVSAQPGWAPPPEVVDLTLDEDRHRYLL